MIEIRILIAHTDEGLVNVATQTIRTKPFLSEQFLAGSVSESLDEAIDCLVADKTGLKVVRKDYPKSA